MCATKIRKKILYLHGMNGSLSHEKREILEQYFEVLAPQLDYNNSPDMMGELNKLFINEDINPFIGLYRPNIPLCLSRIIPILTIN